MWGVERHDVQKSIHTWSSCDVGGKGVMTWAKLPDNYHQKATSKCLEAITADQQIGYDIKFFFPLS